MYGCNWRFQQKEKKVFNFKLINKLILLPIAWRYYDFYCIYNTKQNNRIKFKHMPVSYELSTSFTHNNSVYNILYMLSLENKYL